MTDKNTGIVHWVSREEIAASQQPERVYSPRSDPTANIAIGNIMRDERKKKSHHKRRKPKIQVWRAEDEER